MSIEELVKAAEEDDSVLQVFVIRHGRTPENDRRIIQGHMNTSLNETGQDQAKTCGTRVLTHVPFDAIWSSDLLRCLQTRDLALSSHLTSIPPAHIHETDLLRERGFGDLEGFRANVALEILKQRGQTFETAGEKIEIFQARLAMAWDAILDEAFEHGFKRVAVVTHGGNLVHLLRKQRGYKFADSIPTNRISGLLNTSITIINVTRSTKDKTISSGAIVEFNNAEHLRDEEDATSSGRDKVVDNF
ncbi:histidine phosphatase superfamily [Myxozyma melibiosi]|uniref:Histidine phosphatase superfamily n=1 Tax=Myxozyma melibiosi TaxID=54550 RepID=A0ABR1F7C0_9ASCO